MTTGGGMPALPESAYLNPELGADACPWLDDYIAFSRKWSPREYDDFHEACAVFVLSTVAARRVSIHMGKERFTNLYIALLARTSVYAKSTTAEIARQVLEEAGFSNLLMPDNTTPQRFISEMANPGLVAESKGNNVSLHQGCGQRGWYYDEFGQQIAAMMRPGFMVDFLTLLNQFDNTPPTIKNGTERRGMEIIEQPYLALLASLTPDSLRPFARKGSNLWGGGFLARFALACPPEEVERRKGPFPRG